MGSAESRIGRSFDRESRRTFVAAFDSGLSLKVSPEGRWALEVTGKAVSDEPGGVLLSSGLTERASRPSAFRGVPLLIVRSDFIDVGAAEGRG